MIMKNPKRALAIFLIASVTAITTPAVFGDPMPEWEWDGTDPVEIAQADDSNTAVEPDAERLDGRGKPMDTDIEPLDQWIDMPANEPRTLDHIDVEKLIKTLEADRKLLVEIRRNLPQNRDEAEIYLKRLKTLTSLSDPVRLVPLMNRVLQYSPLYFDWLSTDFETQEAQIIEYYIGGARSFNFALEKYRSMALFIIINRLDIAARTIRELDTIYRREDDE